MNTNFQVTTQTFKTLNEPLQIIPRPSLFTKLFVSKDNKVIKRKVFETKKEWLTWKNNVNQELLNQRILSSKYPDKILTILNYTIETNNHQRNLYITYDCGPEAQPLFQYLNDNSVTFQEQVKIFEQLLQIALIMNRSQFEHTNLKPNNILYYKKQVLLTDFGSARTHYQNFLKEYTAQAEKEWQNNLIFFYPKEYQKIMEEENIDFRNWKEFDISNQKFRKSIDTWAISMMMIQVFENNQTLPNKITDYYGLNNQLLLQKIQNLKQYSAGIFSQVIYSLLIEKQDPENVYQTFIKQKQMVNTESNQMESTFTIKQIFDHNTDYDDISLHSYKPGNYFLNNQQIENLQGQFDDDISSVKSSNFIIDIVNYNEQKPKTNLTLIPQQPPSRNQSATSRQKPQTQKYESTNIDNSKYFDLNPIVQNQSNGDRKKPTIVISNYDLIAQHNQEGVPIDENQNHNKGQQFIPISSQFPYHTENPQQSDFLKMKLFSDDDKIEDINLDKQRNNNSDIQQLQIIQLQQLNDDEQDSHNQSPRFNQNQTQSFQFLQAQKINTIQDKNNDTSSGIVSFSNSQNFQYLNSRNQDLINLDDQQQQGSSQIQQNQGQPQKYNSHQQINLIAIDDFEEENFKNPTEIPKNQDLLQPDQQKVSLKQIKDQNIESQIINRNPQQTNSLIIIPTNENLLSLNDDDRKSNNNVISSQIIKEDVNVNKSQIQLIQPFDDNKNNQSQIKKVAAVDQFSYIDQENLGLLNSFIDQEQDNQNKNKKQQSQIIQIGQNDEQQQLFSPIEDSDNNNLGGQNKTNPFSIQIIKNKLNEGVIQLEDEDQRNILDQLKLIQNVFNKLEQHTNDPTEIFEDEEDKGKKKVLKQVVNEIVKQKEKERLELIEDVNDGVGFILKKQEVDKVYDNNEIEKNPHLLIILNEDQLKQLKEKVKGNQIITNQIQQIIEVKEALKKLKENKNLQNILKDKDIDLLNEEELKIYKHLLEIIGKDKKFAKRILPQQTAIEKRQKEIKKLQEEEGNKQKLIDFLKNPSFDKLLPNEYLKRLNEEERQKYKAALEDFKQKVKPRQKQSIQEQIDLINKIDNNNIKNKPQIKKIDEVDEEESTKQSSKYINNNFQDAFMQAIGKLEKDNDGDILSLNKYIRQFQLTGGSYQITDQIPQDCQKYQQQKKNRKVLYFDYQGSKYKGETINDQPDGMGILRKRGYSSIYKGFFRQGKFYWGQVLEMNDQGQLTQYVGYYHLEYQVKNGDARLKWYQPQRMQCCGGQYFFNDYEIYEGNFVLGFIHGKGKKRYEDFSEYEGDWKKNKREGQGRLTLMKKGEKTITYEGQFKNDVLNGKNIKAFHHYKNRPDLVIEGEYRNGNPFGQHQLIFNNVVQRQIDY
ncbi:unnamed protein product [Paramecium sonneborni]|uniref:MORN repeat-containing protein 3 n=1 Tax=Paramecium sonneborni TaxID=65129 RepID=A0A8S1RBV3_9CILI|nr:unnamed protein product [Paramecium sonneborni]